MRIYNSTITGSLKIKGDIEAENYIVNTTVTALTQSFSSGSTVFGDDVNDTHKFTGSMFIKGQGGGVGESLVLGSYGDGATQLMIRSNGSSNPNIRIERGSSGNNFSIQNNGALNILRNSTALMTFKYTGEVGIGTTSPSVPLEVRKAGHTVLIASSSTAGGGTLAVQSSNGTGAGVVFRSEGGHNRGRIYYDGHINLDNADDAARSVRLRTGQATAASGKDVATIKITPSGSNSGYFNSHGGVSLGRNHGRADSSTSTDFILHVSESADHGLLKLEGSKIRGSSASTGSFGNVEILGSGLPTKVGANTLNISEDGVSSTNDLQISIQGNDLMGMVMHEDGSRRAAVYYDNQGGDPGDGNLMLQGYSPSDAFKIGRIANYFSGSATSTGSFGQVKTDVIDSYQSHTKFKKYIRIDPPAGTSSGISMVGSGDGDYYIDFYNYQGGDPYIRLQTSSGAGTPYMNFKNASYHGLTFTLNSGYNAENFALVSGSNATNRNSNKDTVFRVQSKIHGQTPTQTKMRSGRDIQFYGDVVKYDTDSQPFFSVESNFDEKIISGSAQSTASFGRLMTTDTGNGTSGGTLSQVYSSYQKRNNHARFYPMIMRDMISGTGFIPIELTQTYGSGIYHVIHGEIEIMVSQVHNPLRVHFKAVHSAGDWYRTNVDVISKDGDESIIPIYFANKDDKGYMLIGNAEFSRWSSGTIFIDYLAKTNYDSNFDEMLSVDFSHTVQTNFSDYTINKTHDENYYPTLGRRTASTTSTGYHSIGKFTGTQDMGYARVRIGYGSVATAIFEVDGAYNRFNGKLLATSGYTTFNNYFTGFRVQDSGSAAYLQVNMVGNQSGNAVVELLETNGSFKLLPFEPTGSAGGGATRLEVPLSRHEPYTIVNQDLTLQGGDYADGNVSGSSTSTGSFGMLRVGDGGANLVLRTKSANISIGNMNTYPYVMNSGAGNYNIAIGTETMMSQTSGERNVGVGYQAGRSNVGGDYNTFMGFGAGRGTTSGTYAGNTGLGYQTLYTVNTGDNNVAIGRNALYQLDKGSDSVGIGKSAGYYTTGSYNTFVGSDAGLGGQTSAPYSSGEANTAVGYETLRSFTTGYNNTAVGYRALYAATTGYQNIAVGDNAMRYLTTGVWNVSIGNNSGPNANGSRIVAIGELAGRFNAGLGNVHIGYRAGFQVSGSYNVTIGMYAGQGGTSSAPYSTGIYNTAIGYSALSGFTTGQTNVAIGGYAGASVSSGQKNVAIGYTSLNYLTDGTDSVAVGYHAGYYGTGSYNTFVGSEAGKGGQTSAPYSSGQYNVAMGYQALTGFTTGESNVAVGREAGHDITTGTGNTLVGNAAGDKITTAGYNAVFGAGALGAMAADADENTAIGSFAMSSANNADAIENVAIGAYAGTGGSGALKRSIAIGKNALNSTGTADVIGAIAIGYDALTAANNTNVDYSIAIGYTALNTLQSGQHNIGIGFQALTATNGGQFNIAVGSEAGKFNVNGSNNIYIGYQAARGVSGESQNYNTVIGYQSAYSIDGADHTVALGYQAGYNLRDGDKNVIIGSGAGYNLKDTFENVAIGYQALYTLESLGGDGYDYGQSRSTAVGAYALHLAEDRGETYAGNTAVGHSAGYRGGSNINFSGNVYVGNNAGYWHDAGNSVFIGNGTGQNYMSGSNNVAIGGDAMRGFATSSSTGNDNVVIGDDAGRNWRSSFNSVVVGHNAGYEGAGSRDNTLVGNAAGYNMSGSQQYNTYIGSAAGYGKNLASSNTAVGQNALGGTDWRTLSSVNGDWSGNVAVGLSAGRYAANSFSTFIGQSAGERAGGSSNNFIGYYTGRGTTSSAPYTNGGNNIGIGREALEGFRSGSHNIALGRDAMTSQQDGEHNVAMGYHTLSGAGSATNNTTSHNVALGNQALYYHGKGDYNIAIGRAALYDDVSGSLNVAIGREAGSNNVNGSSNVFIGYQSAYGSSGNSPSYNTGIGFRSLYLVGTGTYNVALGYDSGKNITSGPRNTTIGSYAGDTITTGEQNILIGHSADVSSNAGSNRIGIGYNVSVDTDHKTVIGASTQTVVEFGGDAHVSSSAASTGSFGQVNAGRVRILQESDINLTYLPDLQFYEEGTYTATLTPATSGTITMNTSWNRLGFTRIGNKVHVHGNIIVSSVSSPAGANVALNLPYPTRSNTVTTNGSIRQTGTLVFYNTSNWYQMPIFIDESDSTVLLLVDSYRSLGGSAPPNVNTIANNWQFRIDFHYFIGRFD